MRDARTFTSPNIFPENQKNRNMKKAAYLAYLANSVSTATYTVIKTLAGTGSESHLDGYVMSTSWFDPYAIAVDSNQTIYIADSGNNRIRMIQGSAASTIAGGNSAGSKDATGISATFNNPQGIAVDSSYTLYIADTNNHIIRQISPAGVVTTVAGKASTSGSADGDGTVARFNYPIGIAVDSSGNIYVADSGNNLIRKISSGVVSTLAGSGAAAATNGQSTAAAFNSPQGLAYDASSKNLYVADAGNNLVRTVSSSGAVTTLAGSGAATVTDGTGTGASFYYPTAVALDSAGDLYVADSRGERIRFLTVSTGAVVTFAGNGSVGAKNSLLLTSTFYNPAGVAVDTAGNRIVIADSWNNLIRVALPNAASSSNMHALALVACLFLVFH